MRNVSIIGIGQTESKGLRKGVVINLDATVESIKKVIEEAELMAGVEIGSAYVGVAGTHIKGFNSRGVIAVSSKNRVIDKEDVRRVIDAAKAVSIPMDREILHVLPQEFVVDDQDGIGDPTGMTGTRLEVNVHVITCSTTAAQNTVTCVNRAGLEVIDTVSHQGAAWKRTVLPIKSYRAGSVSLSDPLLFDPSGIEVSDWWPNLATCVDDMAFLHSMTADSPIHGSAMLAWLATNRMPAPRRRFLAFAFMFLTRASVARTVSFRCIILLRTSFICSVVSRGSSARA